MGGRLCTRGESPDSSCQGIGLSSPGVDHADPIGMPIRSRAGLAMFALLFSPLGPQVSPNAVPVASQVDLWPVRYVFDGDTISVGSRVRVRLLGIDTPELGAGFDTPAPFALEARTHLRSLVENRHVRLETDREETDRYGRRLAYVFRDDGLFVNEEMLRAGFARVSARLPLRRLDELRRAELSAQRARRGLWGGQPSIPPRGATARGAGPDRHRIGSDALHSAVRLDGDRPFGHATGGAAENRFPWP